MKYLQYPDHIFYFLFDGFYHHQVDGVFMGFPLGPGLADFFIRFYEENSSVGVVFKVCFSMVVRELGGGAKLTPLSKT